MTWSEALKLAIKDDYKIRRSHWENPKYHVYALGIKTFASNDDGEYRGSEQDRKADNWELCGKMTWFEKWTKKRHQINKFKFFLNYKGD